MVPGPCGRWQRRPTERRDEILAAARTVFGEQGFAKATLADVATRAGVSAATVSHYFGTKAALFEALVADEALEHAAEAPVVVATAGGYRAALHALVERSWRRMMAPGVPELTLTVLCEMRDFPDSARQLFRQVTEAKRRGLRTLLEMGRDAGEFDVAEPEVTSHVISALILGAMLDLHFVSKCMSSNAQPECGFPELLAAVDRLVGVPSEVTTTTETSPDP